MIAEDITGIYTAPMLARIRQTIATAMTTSGKSDLLFLGNGIGAGFCAELLPRLSSY
jgi:hypothetical protein